MRKTDRDFSMIDEMLMVVFGLSAKEVRVFKNTRVMGNHNFMQMKLWKELTEEQFNSLYAIIHNESIESFIELAIFMNKELRRESRNKEARKKYNRRNKYAMDRKI